MTSLRSFFCNPCLLGKQKNSKSLQTKKNALPFGNRERKSNHTERSATSDQDHRHPELEKMSLYFEQISCMINWYKLIKSDQSQQCFNFECFIVFQFSACKNDASFFWGTFRAWSIMRLSLLSYNQKAVASNNIDLTGRPDFSWFLGVLGSPIFSG